MKTDFSERPTIGVIGTGRVGQTLARLLHTKGYGVLAVYNRTRSTADALAAIIGCEALDTPEAVVGACDLTLLTVADDAISEMAGMLANSSPVSLSPKSGTLTLEDEDAPSTKDSEHRSEIDRAASILEYKAIVHTSGAHSLDSLRPLNAQGAMLGSLHPAFPFAHVETAIAGLAGASFAIEADSPILKDWLHDIVGAIGGYALDVQPEDKALYHAAMVIASNYTVTLYALAERLLSQLDARPEAIQAALLGILAPTVANIDSQGIPQALTGPLLRGDVKTIAAHLEALERSNPDIAAAYRVMARMTYPLVEARGTSTEAIEDLLSE